MGKNASKLKKKTSISNLSWPRFGSLPLRASKYRLHHATPIGNGVPAPPNGTTPSEHRGKHKDIDVWLRDLELEEYQAVFQKYSGVEELLELSEREVRDLGVKKASHRARIVTSLTCLRAKEQENREKVKLRVRKYRQALKYNPEKHEEVKRLERERYQRRKEQGKIKATDDLILGSRERCEKIGDLGSKKSYEKKRQVHPILELLDNLKAMRLYSACQNTKIYPGNHRHVIVLLWTADIRYAEKILCEYSENAYIVHFFYCS
nr:unnamed protein product [Callosobruchus analis]